MGVGGAGLGLTGLNGTYGLAGFMGLKGPGTWLIKNFVVMFFSPT